MDSSENQFHDDFKIRKCEILRGHNAYLKVLNSSVHVSTSFLKAYVSQESKKPPPSGLTSEIKAFRESPLFTSIVKVGFVVAKKKIKKAVLRNRIRRLLKESYRLNKNSLRAIDLELNIIFSMTETGYKLFEDDSKTKIEIIEREMKLLVPKIINLLKTK